MLQPHHKDTHTPTHIISMYYYLVSSLPMLRLEEAPAWNSAAFLDACRGHLEPGRLAALAASDLVPAAAEAPSCCAAESRWRAWETWLRNSLADARAAGRSGEQGSWKRPETDVFPGLRRQLEEALNAANPLLREQALDRLRWQFLDALKVGCEFAFDALFVYRLQLLLAEKWAAVDAAAGGKRLQELVAAATARAQEKRRTVEN